LFDIRLVRSCAKILGDGRDVARPDLLNEYQIVIIQLRDGRIVHIARLDNRRGVALRQTTAQFKPLIGDAGIAGARLGQCVRVTIAVLFNTGKVIIAALSDCAHIVVIAGPKVINALAQYVGGVAVATLYDCAALAIGIHALTRSRIVQAAGLVDYIGAFATIRIRISGVACAALGDGHDVIIIKPAPIITYGGLNGVSNGVAATTLSDVYRVVVAVAALVGILHCVAGPGLLNINRSGVTHLKDGRRIACRGLLHNAIIAIPTLGDGYRRARTIALIAISKVVVTALHNPKLGICAVALIAISGVVVTALHNLKLGIGAVKLVHAIGGVVVPALCDRAIRICAVALAAGIGGVVIAALRDLHLREIAVLLIEETRAVPVTGLRDARGHLARIVVLLDFDLVAIARLDHHHNGISAVFALGDFNFAIRARLRDKPPAIAGARAILCEGRDIARPAAGIFLGDVGKRATARRALGDGDLIVAGLIGIRRAARARLRDARLIGDAVHTGGRAILINSGLIAGARLVNGQIIARTGLRHNTRIALRKSWRSHRKRQDRRTHNQ